MELHLNQLYTCKLKTNGCILVLRYLGCVYGFTTWGTRYGGAQMGFAGCHAPVVLEKFNEGK